MKYDIGNLGNLRVLRSQWYNRMPSEAEEQETARIIQVWVSATHDQNVSSIEFSPISEKDCLLILSSECPEIVELMFWILATQTRFSLDTESKFSLLLATIAYEPGVYRELIRVSGFKPRADVSQTLKKIRIWKQYYRRPKRIQRKRGYSDHGSLGDIQTRMRRECLSDFYLKEAQRLHQRDLKQKDFLELFVGYLM